MATKAKAAKKAARTASTKRTSVPFLRASDFLVCDWGRARIGKLFPSGRIPITEKNMAKVEDAGSQLVYQIPRIVPLRCNCGPGDVCTCKRRRIGGLLTRIDNIRFGESIGELTLEEARRRRFEILLPILTKIATQLRAKKAKAKKKA